MPVSPVRLEIRLFGPDDDLDAELDLRRRAFGPISGEDRSTWIARLSHCIAAGEMVGVFDGRRPVASARFYSMRQWWHGRSLPMAGVAGVKVAPEERGRGIGRALMTELLAIITGRGFALSTLYPSTLPLYQSLGWETAGGLYEAVIPAHAVTMLARPDEDAAGGSADSGQPQALRRAGPADAGAVVEVLGRAHESLRDSGPVTREPEEMAPRLADEDTFAYLADDGFLSYHWAGRAGGHEEAEVDYLVAASAATARTFWQILGSHATMADRVRAVLAPADPAAWLLTQPVAVTSQIESWMLRLHDPAQAIAGRGFPAGAAASVTLDLTDRAIPANSGAWTLEVGGGAGTLAPAAGGAGTEAVRLGARGLAALYAGVPPATLRRAGLISGGTGADDALECVFGGPAFMYDYF
jgi:predicted acetyltransferase